MRGRSLSPAVFHKRSRSKSQAPPTPGIDDIFFPKTYENEWDNADRPSADQDIERTRFMFIRSTEIEKARYFLVWFASRHTLPDLRMNNQLLAISADLQHRTVPSLAYAVQMKLFGNRHASFAATPLLQCMRFLLLKARVPEFMVSERTKSVLDFYFDPTMARTLDPPPQDTVTYRYPASRLKVAIVGGGPTALASAISLAEKGAGKVEVHMYERRWVELQGPQGPYIGYPASAKRRDQVVTLQQSVTTLLSKESQQALFEGKPEAVWPGSANIQIRKVEDRLLKRCQADVFKGLIHLHAEGVMREDLAKVEDFHVLLGADGAASWVRKSYFNGYEKERGRSYALGLAFDRPAGLPWSQPLNMFLTLGQTRYLLNASNFDGRGYLNMQLTEDEWHRMVAADGRPVTFGNPGCLRKPDGTVPEGFTEDQVFAPSEDRDSVLWKAIEDGLKLFGFRESEVINVVRIPIVVQAVREGVQYLPCGETPTIQRPHALVAVAGDAAMTVHFWPGRGLNSGIKSGIALGDEIVHALNHGQFIGLPISAMKLYNDFIQKLQGREHDKRSIPILNQSGSPEMIGWLLSKAHEVPECVANEWLVGAMMQIADRLQLRDDWPFPPIANLEPQLRIILRQMTSMTLKEMAVSFPWPTREMGGAEVLPVRSMQPEEKKKWLQQLWAALSDDKGKGSGNRQRAVSVASASRFEAPRPSTPRTSLSKPRCVSFTPEYRPTPPPSPRPRCISLTPDYRPATPSPPATPDLSAPIRKEFSLSRSNARRSPSISSVSSQTRFDQGPRTEQQPRSEQSPRPDQSSCLDQILKIDQRHRPEHIQRYEDNIPSEQNSMADQSPRFEQIPKPRQSPDLPQNSRFEQVHRHEPISLPQESPRLEQDPRYEQAPPQQQSPRFNQALQFELEQIPEPQQSPQINRSPQFDQARRFEQTPRLQQSPIYEEDSQPQQIPRLEQARQVRKSPRIDYSTKFEQNARPEQSPKFEQGPRFEQTPRFEKSMPIPTVKELPFRPSTPGEIHLTRLLSVKKPNQAMLSDAMSLALFRVYE